MQKFNLSKRPHVETGLDLADYCRVGDRLDVNVYTIRAIDAIESAGGGFLTRSKRPKILFEGHYFYRALKKHGLHRVGMKEVPSICFPKWSKRFYKGREREYQRLAMATEFCHKHGISDAAALESASWGRYQIMGANFRLCGFDHVYPFVEAMFTSEEKHLEAFAEYIENSHLGDELIRADRDPSSLRKWRAVAYGYNGAGYKRNKYGIKLRNAALRFRKIRVDCKDAIEKEIQEALPVVRREPQNEGFGNTSLDGRYADTPTNIEDVKTELEKEELLDTTEKSETLSLPTLDQISETAEKVQSATSKVSKNSWALGLSTKLSGWFTFFQGLYESNPILMTFGAILIISALVYITMSKWRWVRSQVLGK